MRPAGTASAWTATCRLFDTAIGMLTYLGTWHLSAGHEPVRTSRSAHPSLVPFQNFPTADGWIVVSCPKEKFWQRLARAIGQPQLLGDERFATFDDRRQQRRGSAPGPRPMLPRPDNRALG